MEQNEKKEVIDLSPEERVPGMEMKKEKIRKPISINLPACWWQAPTMMFLWGLVFSGLIFMVFANRSVQRLGPDANYRPMMGQGGNIAEQDNASRGDILGARAPFDRVFNRMEQMMDEDFNEIGFGMGSRREAVQFSSQMTPGQTSGTMSFAYNGIRMELPYKREKGKLDLTVNSLRDFMKNNAGLKVNLQLTGHDGQDIRQINAPDDLKEDQLSFDAPDNSRLMLLLNVTDEQGMQVVSLRQMI